MASLLHCLRITDLSTRRRAIRGVGVTGAIFLICLIPVVVMIGRPGRIPFHRESWLRGGMARAGGPFSASLPQDSNRAQMVDDLASRHLTLGMTKKNVEELLGEGDWGGGSTASEDHYYSLYLSPTWAEQAFALWHWHGTEPVLRLHYKSERLTEIKITNG
jgi:hypothetical protein